MASCAVKQGKRDSGDFAKGAILAKEDAIELEGAHALHQDSSRRQGSGRTFRL